MKRIPIPKAVRKAVYEKYNGHCAYCGCELDYKDMQVDHVQSVYAHKGDNNKIYLMPACRQCNFYKSTFTIEKFRLRLESINSRLQKVFIFKLAVKYGLVSVSEKPVTFYFERVDKLANIRKSEKDLLKKE